jgi:hypothetical protein
LAFLFGFRKVFVFFGWLVGWLDRWMGGFGCDGCGLDRFFYLGCGEVDEDLVVVVVVVVLLFERSSE